MVIRHEVRGNVENRFSKITNLDFLKVKLNLKFLKAMI